MTAKIRKRVRFMHDCIFCGERHFVTTGKFCRCAQEANMKVTRVGAKTR